MKIIVNDILFIIGNSLLFFFIRVKTAIIMLDASSYKSTSNYILWKNNSKKRKKNTDLKKRTL